MDNVRLLLFMALAFLGMLLYQAWQQDYGPARQVTTEATPSSAHSADTPVAPQQADIDDAAPSVPGVTPTTDSQDSARLIKVRTDTLDLVIDSRGGTIIDARLVGYPVAVELPDEKYRLLSQRPSDYFIAQSGLLGPDSERTPTHEAVFSAAQQQ